MAIHRLWAGTVLLVAFLVAAAISDGWWVIPPAIFSGLLILGSFAEEGARK